MYLQRSPIEGDIQTRNNCNRTKVEKAGKHLVFLSSCNGTNSYHKSLLRIFSLACPLTLPILFALSLILSISLLTSLWTQSSHYYCHFHSLPSSSSSTTHTVVTMHLWISPQPLFPLNTRIIFPKYDLIRSHWLKSPSSSLLPRSQTSLLRCPPIFVYLYAFLLVSDVFFPPGKDYPARFSSNAHSTVKSSWHPQAKLDALSNLWTVMFLWLLVQELLFLHPQWSAWNTVGAMNSLLNGWCQEEALKPLRTPLTKIPRVCWVPSLALSLFFFFHYNIIHWGSILIGRHLTSLWKKWEESLFVNFPLCQFDWTRAF